MAIKTISQFPSGIPADNDYILFEQNGEGKSAKFSDFSLSYEEIMATNPEPDLSGKVASAEALKNLNKLVIQYIEPTFTNGVATFDMSSILASNNMTKINSLLVQFESGSISGNIVRSCTKVNDTTIKIVANTNSLNGPSGCFIVFG